MTDISLRYRALADEFGRRLAAVPDDGWDNATPCAGWTTRDLLGHVLDSYRNMPGSVGQPIEPTSSVKDDPLAAWSEVDTAMQGFLDDPARADLEYDGYFGRTTVAKTVDSFLGFDLLVHAWDVARATGQDETLPADEVHQVYQAALGMGDMLRSDGVCGPEVPVPADAPEQDRLLGLLGRTP
ncbi:MAG: TIGR03086 family metal-binding protein [Actinocatenispora sp.]